jgi:hypothetical protein
MINQIERGFVMMGLGILRKNSESVPLKGDNGEVVNWVDVDELYQQVDSLVVIGKCQCGDPMCHTVQFQHYKVGQSSEIFSTVLDDSRTMSIFVNRMTGMLSGLQVVAQ